MNVIYRKIFFSQKYFLLEAIILEILSNTEGMFGIQKDFKGKGIGTQKKNVWLDNENK